MKYSRYGLRRRKHRRFTNVRPSLGILFRALAFLAIVAVGVAVVRWIAGGHDSHKSVVDSSDGSRSLSRFAGQSIAGITARNRRIVYPYSVVPGGVTSGAELREVAAHDATVAQHYKGFDYSRARIIRVERPSRVYLSYRRGNHVYWTRKQISLHQGEKLLTDGSITARTRCGNQVSVLPRAETAPEEPTEAELDRPDAVASGIQEMPGNLTSRLLQLDPSIPVGPPSSGLPTFGPPGAFVPLPIGSPVAGSPGTGPGNGCSPGTEGDPNCPPPPPPPPTVPEPGTVILMASGAAAVYARFRMKMKKS